MKRLVVIMLLISAVSPALAKPKYCLTKPEYGSELVIRHGIFLRELSARCESYQPGSKALWKAFDDKFGTRLRAERTRRESGFKREFPDDWLKDVTTFDARLVTYNRNLPITKALCEDVKSMLDDNKKSGWGSFIKQSGKLRDLSHEEVIPCQ
jgi:hypothetical protein